MTCVSFINSIMDTEDAMVVDKCVGMNTLVLSEIYDSIRHLPDEIKEPKISSGIFKDDKLYFSAHFSNNKDAVLSFGIIGDSIDKEKITIELKNMTEIVFSI